MLRPYQAEAKSQTREHFKSGKRKVLLHLATGGGKTVIFSDIMKDTVKAGKRPIMVVRGRKLVDQASERLRAEGVYHGVMMAGHWNYQPIAPVQICSIDTLISRGSTPPADLIVIDEAHMAVSSGYHKWLANYPNAYILAVSATPFVRTSLRHIADAVIKPITVSQLVAQGYLVEARYYAPAVPDLSEVKISRATNDYDSTQLSEIMDSKTLVGDIVTHWKKLGEDRPTICFASTVQHSKNIVQQFKERGVPAEHCEANTNDKEREEILERLKSGITKVVSNVGILCTGVDMPYLGCIVMARPTKSYNLYIQQAGRGTRPYPGKNNFILLDHAGNSLRHGFIDEERDVDLDGTEIKLEKTPKVCSSCFAVYYGFNCSCGFSNPEPVEAKRDKITLDGELEEIHTLPIKAMILRDVEIFKEMRRKRGYKPGWEFHKIKEKWGEQIAFDHFPYKKRY